MSQRMSHAYHVVFTVHPLATTSRAAFAGIAAALLKHGRGWESKEYAFTTHTEPPNVPAEQIITVTLAPQRVLDHLFPEFAQDRLSVCNLVTREVYLNEERWHGVYEYNKSNMPLPAYRAYMVNHEIGHALGFMHARLTDPGTPCPIMVQQTLGTGACYPFPFPSAPSP